MERMKDGRFTHGIEFEEYTVSFKVRRAVMNSMEKKGMTFSPTISFTKAMRELGL